MVIYRDGFDLKYGVGILRVRDGFDVMKVPDDSYTLEYSDSEDDEDSSEEGKYSILFGLI